MDMLHGIEAIGVDFYKGLVLIIYWCPQPIIHTFLVGTGRDWTENNSELHCWGQDNGRMIFDVEET